MITRAQVAALIAAVLVGGGIAFAGWFLGHAYLQARAPGGTVSVEGVAERQVTADSVVWPFHLTATADVLKAAQAELDSDRSRLMTFLTEAGFVDASVSVSSPRVTDREASAGTAPASEHDRYIVRQTVVLRTPNVQLVHDVASQTRKLVRDGVSLGAGDGETSGGPHYLFTRLNEIRPSMLAQATTNARATAEQFAADAGAKLGPITRAEQGAIKVLPRGGHDAGPARAHRHKTVRVVSSVTFRLNE